MQSKMESYSIVLKLGKHNIKYQVCRLLNWNIFTSSVTELSQLQLFSNFKYP